MMVDCMLSKIHYLLVHQNEILQNNLHLWFVLFQKFKHQLLIFLDFLNFFLFNL